MLFKHRPDPLCAFSCKGDSFPICKVRETALCAVGQYMCGQRRESARLA